MYGRLGESPLHAPHCLHDLPALTSVIIGLKQRIVWEAALSEAFKVCPICETRNQRHAALCATCGATIADVTPQEPNQERDLAESRYDFRLGETDLAEESLSRTGRILSALLILFLVLSLAGIAYAVIASRTTTIATGADDLPTAKPTRVAGPTVTPGPPSATFTLSPIPTADPTITSTPAPCLRKVEAGDSLIGIVMRCGHRELDILPTVMQLNGIADEALIRIGQEIIVPLPSPTLDPAATAKPTDSGEIDSASADSRAIELALLAFDPLSPTETPTLLPGLMWHTVQPDENMIVIAMQYKTDAKALSDLNPEIEFLLCEFGVAYGGPECTVKLFQGQRMRVPAPTPTMTLIPTASGSETPTPLPTATFNAPIAQSPPDEAFFSALEQVTLRWVATGRLSPTEVYRLALTDTDTGARYTAETRELFHILPETWRPNDLNSHVYAWQVGVLDTSSGRVSHSSAERSFVWQGTGQTGS